MHLQSSQTVDISWTETLYAAVMETRMTEMAKRKGRRKKEKGRKEDNRNAYRREG